MQYHILVVDDEPTYLEATKNALESKGYIVHTARNGDEAIEKVKDAPKLYALVILDYRMPGKDGAQTAQALISINPDIYILIYSSALNFQFRAGQVEFVDKNAGREVFLRTVETWCTKYDATTRTVTPFTPFSVDEKDIASTGMIGSSPAMGEIARFINKIKPQGSDLTVLITGEDGTGKEIIAKAIHRNSTRHNHPFVSINCGAIPEGLVESELFGHVKGAFTGADSKKIGKFEFAERGTLFLDEIGEMPLHIQVKLLRVLQEREFSPVGENRVQKTDVRIIAATNRNLEKMISEGKFRKDLYYRIQTAELFVPPLRERTDDIKPLVAHFCYKFNQSKRTNKTLLMSAVGLLANYSWPGNVRELENFLNLLLATTQDNEIGPRALPLKFWDKPARQSGSYGELCARHEEEERDFFRNFLDRYQDESKRKIAQRVGLPFTTFCSTLRRLKLEEETMETKEQTA